MQRRRIPILDPFFDRMSLLLWPRFKQIVDSNIKSIKTANFKKLGPVDLSPHYVSRRFAELVASISSLQGRSSVTMNQSQGIFIFQDSKERTYKVYILHSPHRSSRLECGEWIVGRRSIRNWWRRRTHGSTRYSNNANRNNW
jgi:hypothetical protein